MCGGQCSPVAGGVLCLPVPGRVLGRRLCQRQHVDVSGEGDSVKVLSTCWSVPCVPAGAAQLVGTKNRKACSDAVFGFRAVEQFG